MATGFMCFCECGKKYYLYVPKLRLIRQISDNLTDKNLENLKRCDKEEIENGKIELCKQTTKMSGATFIDGSIRDAYQCECGKIIDIDALEFSPKPKNGN